MYDAALRLEASAQGDGPELLGNLGFGYRASFSPLRLATAGVHALLRYCCRTDETHYGHHNQ
jgi:hypothetical protein